MLIVASLENNIVQGKLLFNSYLGIFYLLCRKGQEKMWGFFSLKNALVSFTLFLKLKLFKIKIILCFYLHLTFWDLRSNKLHDDKSC